jgi:protein-tyrosine phosphatase
VAPALEHANADFVTERLAVGGDLSSTFATARTQLDELVAAGITHIVDLRSEWSDELLVRGWAPRIRYWHYGIPDAGQQIDSDWFEILTGWVRGALSDPEAKVLLHCHMGVNRAPSAVLAVLLDQGFGLRDALEAIRDARPIAVIDYADSVLEWHLGRTEADARRRRNARRVLVRWRASHGLNPEDVIRQLRSQERPATRWAVRLGPDDPGTLAGVLSDSGEVAVGLTVDHNPAELSQLDEVIFLTERGLNGRALVVGPVDAVESGALLMPVMITDLFADAMHVRVPERVADWLAASGPNPLELSRIEYHTLTTRQVQTVAAE